MLTILVDTREQLPYEWSDCISKVATLKTGDYSLPGEQDRVTIERKRVAELYTIVGKERERFERELERMADMDYAAIVIEGNVEDVLAQQTYSSVPPKAVINSLVNWSVCFNVQVWWAGNRVNGCALTRSLLRRFSENRLRL